MAGLGAALLSGCSADSPPPSSAVRPVRSTVVHYGAAGELVSLSGQIQAQNQTKLAFRIGGRLLERRVSVGDAVVSGQLVARIEAQDTENALRSAQAELISAQATLQQAQQDEARYRTLVASGVVPRVQYEDAQQRLASATAQAVARRSAQQNARDNVSYTELRANAAGVVTAKGVEPGEVVQAGQMVVLIAQKGGKDAVFNVPAPLMRDAPRQTAVSVSLADDPAIAAAGHVREVSPQADPATGTYTVKVALENPPDTMRLGATVIGSATLSPEPVASVPGTALIQFQGKPAVWVVNPTTHAVQARPVEVLRYDSDAVIIGAGLKSGDRVVTAGVHALQPGQSVELLQETASTP